MNNRVEPFLYESQERNGTLEDKISNLKKTIAHHVHVIGELRKKVDRCLESHKRWKHANRSVGYLVRILRKRNRAVFYELLDRECRAFGHYGSSLPHHRHIHNRALALYDTSAQARYLVRYVHDNQRIECEMQMDDAGISKPSRGGKLTTARTPAYERNDVNAARSLNVSLMRTREVRRQYRNRLKNCKREIRNLRNYLERTLDPPSADKHGFGSRV